MCLRLVPKNSLGREIRRDCLRIGSKRAEMGFVKLNGTYLLDRAYALRTRITRATDGKSYAKLSID